MAKYKRKRKYPTGGPIVPEPVFLSNGGNPPIKNYTLNIGNRSFNVPVPDFKRLKDKWANLNDAEKMAALGLTAGSAAIYDEVENRKLQQEETGLGYQNNRRVKASFNYGGIPHDPPYVQEQTPHITYPYKTTPSFSKQGIHQYPVGMYTIPTVPTGGAGDITDGTGSGDGNNNNSGSGNVGKTKGKGIPDAIFNYGGKLGTDPPFTKAEFQQGMTQGIPNNAISLSGNNNWRSTNDKYQYYLGEDRIKERSPANKILSGLGFVGLGTGIGYGLGNRRYNQHLPLYQQQYSDYVTDRTNMGGTWADPSNMMTFEEYQNFYNPGSEKKDYTKLGAIMGLGTSAMLTPVTNAIFNKINQNRRDKQARELREAMKDDYRTGGYMKYANGGNMGQFSSVPVTEFNNGGTHEANPLGGIPQGPNALVEEGELKIKIPGTDQDFIVSPKIKLDKATAQEFGLPMKYVGKNMVDIFNKVLARKNFNQREGDTITNTTMQDNIAPYIEAHDYLTEKKNAEEEAMRQESFAADMDNMMTEYPDYMQALMAQQQPQQGPSPEEQAMMAQQGQPSPEEMAMMQQQGAPQGMPMMGIGGMMEYKNGGLWANIHKKRARIKAGSGEKMREPGSEGAPTEEALKESQNAMGGYLYKNGGYNNAGFKALPNYVQTKIKGNSMANGGYNYADFMMPGVPVQGVAASNYRYGGRYGCAPRKDFGGFMRGLGEAGYGVLQGTLSAVPGVGQFVDPLMEKGRVALQDATGATEEDKRKGEVISSIGNITGSLVTGNPKAALGQADEVADILQSVGPTDNPENETRKNLDAAANYINTAGRFLPMLSGQIGKNKASKEALEGIDSETGLKISVNPNLPNISPYHMYGGRKRYAYGGALSQPIKFMTYPHNQMIMANGGTIPPEDLEYIKKIIKFEREHGSFSGEGLSDAEWTHGKAGISSGNDDKKAAQFIYDNYVKPLEKLNLPVDVRKRAVDMYLNSEDPRASLMVAAGLITPEEKLELYNIKNPDTGKGMINPKDLDKLWEKHGDATIAFAQSENAAELFDAEKHRSYGKGSTYNKSWGPRIDQWQDDYKYENWKPNKYYKQDEGKKTFSRVAPKGDTKKDTKTINTTSVSEDDINAAKSAGVKMINTDDLTGRELELAEFENKTRAAKFKNNPADPSIPTKELIPTSEESDPSRSTYYSPESRDYTADRAADSRDMFFMMRNLQQMNPDKSSEEISKMANDLLKDRGMMDAYSSFMGLPSYFDQGQAPAAPGPVTEPTEPEGDEGFTPIPVPTYDELMKDMPEEEIVIEDIAGTEQIPPEEEELNDYQKALQNIINISENDYIDQKIKENNPDYDELREGEQGDLRYKYMMEYRQAEEEARLKGMSPNVGKGVSTTKLRPTDKVPITPEIQADIDATEAAGGTVTYNDDGSISMEAGKSGEGDFSRDVITGEGTEDEDATTTPFNYYSPLTGMASGTADAGTEVKESIYPWALAGTQAGYNILAPILAKKFRGEDYVEDPSYMDAIDYDLSEERRELQREVAGARKNLKNISGGNAGAYLTNLGSMYDRFRRGVAGSYARENLLETQANMEVDKYNKMLDAQRARDIGAINYSEDAQRRANILAGTTAAFEGMQTPFQNRITEQAGINFVNAALGPKSPYRMSYVPIGEQWRRRKNDTT